MKRYSIVALALTVLAATVAADTPLPLSIGDQAPPIKVGGWAKGVPVPSVADGKLYVVEFWATWSDPSKACIERLTELRKKYMDPVTFLGVSVDEKGEDIPGQVKKFVAAEGNKMYYKVAFDTDDDAMAKTWLQASDESSLPIAFVVQGGKIMWIGEPTKGLDEALGQIIAGTYDLAKAKAAEAAERAAAADDEKSAQDAYDQAMAAKDFPKALSVLDGFLAKHPNLEPDLAETKVRVMLLIDKAKGLAYADAQGAKKPAVFIDVAIMLIHDTPPLKADPAVAVEYAKKADAGFEGKQPYVKIILAQAYKVDGQKELGDTTFKAGIDLAKQLGAPQETIDSLTRLYDETK